MKGDLERAMELAKYYRQADLSELKARIDRTISRKRKRRVAAISCVAAAAAVTMALIFTNPKEIHRFAPSDVVLTLAGGRAIALGEQPQGTIAEGITHSTGELTFSGTTAAVEQNLLEVPRGTRFDLTLEDGTRVWLNAGSTLKFPSAFEADRRVELTGEACFDVAHDAKRPFIVNVGQERLTVLGTRFNICAYSENAVYSLLRGSVAVEALGKKTTLIPGQQARFAGGDWLVSPAAGSVAWLDGDFSFEGSTLEDVFRRLSRWYDFDYEFADPATARLRLMGQVPMYDDLDAILGLIEASGTIKIDRKQKTLIITNR